MGEFAQKRIIRKLELERFLSRVSPQLLPRVELEQYTISEHIAANMLYIAAYSNGDILGKKVLDLGCGTGRFALGAAFLGARQVVGIDIDRSAVDTASENSKVSNLKNKVQWILGDIGSITGQFDTVLQNPPFGVQRREADRPFLVKALEVGSSVYSLHSHPEVDDRLIKRLKSSKGFLSLQATPFLERFVEKNNGYVESVYAMLMTIPRLFDFHKKIKHDFVVDLYVIKKKDT